MQRRKKEPKRKGALAPAPFRSARSLCGVSCVTQKEGKQRKIWKQGLVCSVLSLQGGVALGRGVNSSAGSSIQRRYGGGVWTRVHIGITARVSHEVCKSPILRLLDSILVCR